MSGITTADVARTPRGAGGRGGERTINRELACLKRMFTLAVQAGRLVSRPHIPMLAEDNTRRGFLERDQFELVRAHLPAALRPLVTVAYYTGWRKGELLNLQWRNVDTAAKTIRLDPGTTKNREGRLFVYAGLTELEDAIADRAAARDALRLKGTVCPFVFHRDGAPVRSFRRAWASACKAAACRDASSMTCGGRRFATSNARACRARPRWRWSGTRRRASTGTTPSSARAT